MSNSTRLMEYFSDRIKDGYFDGNIRQLIAILMEEGFKPQPLVDKLIFEGESKYLQMCCQENRKKEAIYLSSCRPDELMDVMKLIAFRFSKVLKTKLKIYSQTSHLELILDDLSDSFKKDDHYVGVYFGRNPSLVVSKGKDLYFFSEFELDIDSPYNSMLVFADELTTERVSQHVKGNESIMVVDRKMYEKNKGIPPMDCENPFRTFIESAENIRV